MLPTVDFCGLKCTRLIIGANPFGGYSHQSQERNEEMRNYHTIDRILETWHRAETAGINTFVTNNETGNIMDAVKAYRANGGKLQWIAQLNRRQKPDMSEAIAEVAEIGCSGVYFHGLQVEETYEAGAPETLAHWCADARRAGLVVGAAAHAPVVHRWVDSLDLVDFHAVCFFNCGSVHKGEGEKFQLKDVALATACAREIKKPCIGYKIMGAGRIDPKMAFEYAFDSLKPGDIVNVGMHRGDNDNMVEENVAMVRDILGG